MVNASDVTGGQGVAGSNPVSPTVETAAQGPCPERSGTAPGRSAGPLTTIVTTVRPPSVAAECGAEDVHRAARDVGRDVPVDVAGDGDRRVAECLQRTGLWRCQPGQDPVGELATEPGQFPRTAMASAPWARRCAPSLEAVDRMRTWSVSRGGDAPTGGRGVRCHIPETTIRLFGPAGAPEASQ